MSYELVTNYDYHFVMSKVIRQTQPSTCTKKPKLSTDTCNLTTGFAAEIEKHPGNYTKPIPFSIIEFPIFVAETLSKYPGCFGYKAWSMDKVNIFIAEDDRDDFLLLMEAIETVLPKFNVNHSRDGKAFLQSLNAGVQPDLIFLDLNSTLSQRH